MAPMGAAAREALCGRAALPPAPGARRKRKASGPSPSGTARTAGAYRSIPEPST
jgi:hypothetical protein